MIFSSHDDNASTNFWPGFVDALSSLLIVVIFVVMGFFVSQVYLADALNHSDSSVRSLQSELAQLQQALSSAQKDKYAAQESARLSAEELKKLQGLLNALQLQDSKIKTENSALQGRVNDLLLQMQNLNTQLSTERQEFLHKEASLRALMDTAITEKVAELKRVRTQLLELKAQIPPAIRQNPELLKYRSEFFDALQNILGDRPDIKVVGDRFVFQSEVLFAQGSDQLGTLGEKALNQLAVILQDISQRIPTNIHWVLRIDGHTDQLPIHNERFESNWELSVARAASVAKYLISRGISPKHLMITGFAEYYPITKDPDQMAKNRRIEFRLDQR